MARREMHKRHRLAQRREALGYSQEGLARLLGVERSTIVRWECGETTPRPALRPPLATALQLSLGVLSDLLDDVVPDVGESTTARRPGSELPGEIIETLRAVTIDIGDDGAVSLSYRYEILNNTTEPFSRLVREVWFEEAHEPLAIVPLSNDRHHVAIQRMHESRNLVKFACLVSPPVGPGDTAVVTYDCTGGRFLDNLYWRQAILRHTQRLLLTVRHRGAEQLLDYSAVDEQPDGSERLTTRCVVWNYDGHDVLLSLAREQLRPGQAVTLRWKVSNPAGGGRSEAT